MASPTYGEPTSGSRVSPKLIGIILALLALYSMMPHSSPVTPSDSTTNLRSDPNPATQASNDCTDCYLVELSLSGLSNHPDSTVLIEVHPAWAPIGAAHFQTLVTSSFFTDTKIFRVIPNFMAQFGIHGDPVVMRRYKDNKIKDDVKGKKSNERGTVTFATSGPNSRTTQLFINFKNNAFLDGQGFTPFGTVISGMDTVDAIYSKYGESPNQGKIQNQGNAYLNKDFPLLTTIVEAKIVTP